jgi:hypothetical protein
MLGHNQPPLADRLALDHGDLAKRAAEAAAMVPAELRAIETDDEAAAYTDTAADIKAVIKEVEAAFKVEKAPWLDGGRTVDGFFANIGTPLRGAVDRVVKALNARQAARLAAERKAAAEAAEKARKEAIAFDEPVPVAAPVVVKEAARVVSITTGAKATGSVKWRPRVVAIDQVPRQYMMVNEKALQAAVDGGIREIPGVEVYEEVRTSIRR